MRYQINGQFMCGDDPIADIRQGVIIPLQEARLPFYLQRNDDLYGWLENRAVDRHRTNSRLLKRLARIAAAEDPDVSMAVYAATITDQFWVRPEGCRFSYQEVRFHANPLSTLALYGDLSPFSDGTWERRIFSPEFTNIGSFEKCWRKENGVWWLYKSEDTDAQYAELFICSLGKALGISMAEYAYADGYIKSRDVTGNAACNLDHARGLIGENYDDYGLNYSAFSAFSPEVASSYVRMLYLDALCRNVDRHSDNYGVLRDPSTGNVLCFAPLFDHNISLLTREAGGASISAAHDMLTHDFCSFIKESKIAFEQPIIDEQCLREIAASVPIPYEGEQAVQFVLARQKWMQQNLCLCKGYSPRICGQSQIETNELEQAEDELER